MSLRTILLGTCLALALVPIARTIFLFVWRQPRLARTVSHDYPDSVRMAEGDYHRAALFDGHARPSDFHYRDVNARVAYEVDDIEVRSDVVITTHKGDEPDSLPIVWVDPDNPEDSTARGPSFWLSWLLLIPPIAYAAWQLPH